MNFESLLPLRVANHFGGIAGFLVFHYTDDRMQSEYRPIAAGPKA